MKQKRARLLNDKNFKNEGPVAYWMSRDQRADDNWALLFAQELAIKYNQPLTVVFCLVEDFLGATSS
jgi:deoxyribodipyrimidine photo-lyase